MLVISVIIGQQQQYQMLCIVCIFIALMMFALSLVTQVLLDYQSAAKKNKKIKIQVSVPSDTWIFYFMLALLVQCINFLRCQASKLTDQLYIHSFCQHRGGDLHITFGYA